MVDRDAHQAPSPTVNIAPVLTIQHWMTTPNLSRGYITKADAEQWEEFFAFFEILRVPGADVELGGRRYGLFVRDFDAIPVNDWLELMLERDLTGDAAPRPSPAPVELALSAPDFEAAVRQALRDLHRPALLAGNPLARSSIAADATVRELLCDAIERLAVDPRDAKLHRVLDRTYLRPAASQEKAAEVLGLPLSTYKRHHKRAVERIVADLWHLELTQK
jgi:hypothetical protein